MRFVLVIIASLAATAGLVLHEQWKQRHDADLAQRAQRLADSMQAGWEYEWRERERESQHFLDMVSRYGAEYVTRDSAGRVRLRTQAELNAYRRAAGLPEGPPELRRICGTFSGEFQCVTVWSR